MELKEGMYVRYIRSFKNNDKPIIEIDKITKINNYVVHLETWENNAVYSLEPFKDFIKGEPSFNIIDLIEVGDILKFKDDKDYQEVKCIEDDRIYLSNYIYITDSEENKKEIEEELEWVITKEQLNKMKYEVK